uniref:SEC63 homolog, protein translocation regulator n=1 Tax=Cyclopterus lumpus TaxID=8103 RepID=A0A8C2ZW43_CYCLU
MAGQQFQYDDSGNTFFYFLTSFVGLIVVPATYYLWPRDQNAEQLRLKSLRRVHGRCLWYRLRLMKSQQSIVPTLKKAALLFGWAVFLLLAYKVSKLDREYQEYNPYEVLNLDPGASLSEIKKQYRVLSLKYHPDKGGDESTFMRIAKAYAAKTTSAFTTSFVSLFLTFSLYSFFFFCPSISGDQILINTTQLFMHFMYKTPNMNMKRLAMVLTAAFEFDPRSNKDATIRPTDNIEVPQLIRELGNINVKKKEPPFCYPYSLKARVLVLAHLARMDVSEELEEDQRFVVRKSPALLQEMINVGCQLTMMANSRGGFHAPRLVTIENCMKLTQMIVQGLQESKSPLLQLPHFEEEHLRYCISKKYKVRSLQDLVSLKDSDRRSMLRFLGEDKYDEVLAVLGSFPHIAMVTKLQVLDDEDSNNITAGSIVTVTVTLTRKRMAVRTCLHLFKPMNVKEMKHCSYVCQNLIRHSFAPVRQEWEALQQSIQRRERALLETKSKVTHPVYSLYFPEEKHEWWWLYIADRRDQTLVSMPYHVCTLKDTEEVELKFPAPSKTGNYQYSIILRSDSYLGLDQIRPLKLEVHEAKAMLDNHPQWDIPDTEEEDEEQEDSDGIEESEDDEEDND